MDIEDLVNQAQVGRRLDVDLGTKLLLQVDGVDSYLKTTLNGMEGDTFLMVRTPRLSGVRSKLKPGNKVIVRYLAGGSAYGFQSKILGHISEPFPLMFLSYPDIVSRNDLRKHHRVETRFSAEIHLDQKKLPVVVEDLSLGGCRIKAKRLFQSLTVGSRFFLSCNLPELEPLKHIEVKVRNRQEEAGRTCLGLQFMELGKDQKHALIDFLDQMKEFS